MEQIKSQKSLTEKLKRYTLLPLMAMGVSLGAFSSTANADPSEIKQMDAETVSKVLNYKTKGNRITDTDKKEALKAFKRMAKEVNFPKELVKRVTLDTILDFSFGLDERDHMLYADDGIFICIQKHDGRFTSFPTIGLYKFQERDIAEPLPPISKGINTVTKKPYFSMPKALASKLSDKEYFKTLYKVMNSNFGTMMPMPQLSQKKVDRNEYAGKLVDQPLAFFGKDFPMLEKDMDETEISIRRELGFIVNGALEMIKAGAKADLSTSCTGWDGYSFEFEKAHHAFIVYNGISNKSGSIPHVRIGQIYQQAAFLVQFRTGFRKLMQEHGVEPGTSFKQKGLTPDQQVLAAWSGALDNYINTLFEKKILGIDESPYVENQKMKTLDQLIGPENPMPPKEIKKIDIEGFKEVQINKESIHLKKIQSQLLASYQMQGER